MTIIIAFLLVVHEKIFQVSIYQILFHAFPHHWVELIWILSSYQWFLQSLVKIGPVV